MIDNKMVVNKINLDELLSMNLMDTTTLMQEEYDLLQQPNPNTIYIIINSPERRIYVGRNLADFKSADRMYLIGPGKCYGEYTLWLNEKVNYEDRLVEISSFKDPQKAINAMNRYNRVGSHTNLAISVYNVLISYLLKEVSLHEFIMGIIALFGYRDDRRFQELLQRTMTTGVQQYKRSDLPLQLKDQLHIFKRSANHLFCFYSDLYDLVVFYDFFKDRKYQENTIYDVDLSEVIERIFKTIIKIS